MLGAGEECDQDPRGPHLHAPYILVVCTDGHRHAFTSPSDLFWSGKEHMVGIQPGDREAGEFSQRQKAGERCPRQRGRPVWNQGVK